MYLTDKIENLISTLKNQPCLKDVQIIKAYPFVNKPTNLEKIVITVSPSGLNADNISVGQNCYFGSYMIDFDVFSPQELGSPIASSTIESVILSLRKFNPSAIKVEPISINSNVKCYTAKCTLTFSGEIDFGGDNYGT